MLVTIRVTTTGSAGSATGSAVSEVPIRGYLESIKTDFTTAAATTDVTITETLNLGRTLLTLTDKNTDRVDYPRYPVQGNTGSDIAGVYTRAYIDWTTITVSVAQADPVTNNVVVTIQTVDEAGRP